MSKKHFIRLAQYIQAQGDFSMAQLECLAKFCREQNPSFKWDRWFNYIKGQCGPNGGTIKPK